MTESAHNAFEHLREDLNREESKDQQRDAFEARMKLITEKAAGALRLAFQGDLLQIKEIERLRAIGNTEPYEYDFYVQTSDSDEELGFDSRVVSTKTVSIRLASDPSNPKEGNELFVYFPVPDDFIVEADTEFLAIGSIREFFALKKVRHPSGDYDTYLHFSPEGVRSVPQPSRKVQDQLDDFRKFISEVAPEDFEETEYTRNDVEAMRRDLFNMKLVEHKRSIV